MQIKQKQLEKGVTIYFEGLPGNPTADTETTMKGFELYAEIKDEHLVLYGWCGMEEPILKFQSPFLKVNDLVHVYAINPSLVNERTDPEEFTGRIIMLEPSNGLGLVEDDTTGEYRLVEWGRINKV